MYNTLLFVFIFEVLYKQYLFCNKVYHECALRLAYILFAEQVRTEIQIKACFGWVSDAIEYGICCRKVLLCSVAEKNIHGTSC